MYKKTILAIAILLVNLFANAQGGSMQVTFTPAGGGKQMMMQFTAPLLKFDNPHGYWFINPHNGDRHMQYMPDAGWGDRKPDVAFITMNEKKDDFFFYDQSGNDSNQVTIKNNNYIISAPEYNRDEADKNKPLHVHINSFTASACSFTISGAARLATVKDNSWVEGSITGSAHFYREPKYDKSDVLPGCDCDPTIYASFYDKESNSRTTSACETALRNKIFDAVQKALAPVVTNIAFKGSAGMAAGNIDITILPGHADIKAPVKERPYCSSDYRHNWLTGLNAHKTFFTSDDTYGLRFIKIPTAAELGGGSTDPDFQKRQAVHRDTLIKQMMAGKITADQYTKSMDGFNQRNGVETPDYKKMEMNHNLYLQVIINPDNRETMLMKLGDKNNTKIQHNVKGSAYEVFTGQLKESDGSWISNKLYVYIGKFDAPVAGKSGGGYDAEISTAIYPPNGNKLGVYSIIIKMEGDKDMADKAIANIDFDILEKLITPQ
ncbi:MAG: hypothetical protein ABJB86_14785 [Bacteroidota bacterium]